MISAQLDRSILNTDTLRCLAPRIPCPNPPNKDLTSSLFPNSTLGSSTSLVCQSGCPTVFPASLFSLSFYLIPQFLCIQASVPYLPDASATMIIVDCLTEDPIHFVYLHLCDFISSLTQYKDNLQGTKAFWQYPLQIPDASRNSR